MLTLYAGHFNSVEINYTFRKEPTDEVLAAWKAATPEGFLFTLKAHRRLTHWLRLADADDALARFLGCAMTLGPRLGVVLFQCPPNLRFDPALIESFLRSLPAGFRYAFEFRHQSWTQARDALSAHGAAWCVADTDDQPALQRALDRAPFAYVRLRKTAYGEAELVGWATQIRTALRMGSDVFCYFKHEVGATGPQLAIRLSKLVGGL